MASPLPPMEALDLAEFDLIDLQAVSSATTVQDEKLKTTEPSSTASIDSSLPKPEDGFRFSDLDLVSEALVLTSYARFKGLVKKDNSEQWEEVNGLEKLEVGCGYRTENSIPIRRLSRDELLIGGKIRMLLERLPPGCASPARGKYLATLRGYFDRSTGVIALEALSQMKFENGIPLAHYNRDGPSDKCLRVHSFDKIRIGIAYMVAYTDGLLKFKRISQGEIYIHYKRRREMLVVRSQEIKTGKIEAIKCKKRTPLVDADKENLQNLAVPFPRGKGRNGGRSPVKRRTSMAASGLHKSSTATAAKGKKPTASTDDKPKRGGFSIFSYFFSARPSASSVSPPASPLRRSPARKANNRRKSMGAALFSDKEKEEIMASSGGAPPPPPPPGAPMPPPPPFATPLAPPPPGGLRLGAKRGLSLQANGDFTTPTPRKKMRSLYWSVIPKDKLQQTVWCSQEVLSSPSINVDVSRLESLFSVSPDKKTNKFTPRSGKEANQSPLVAILTLPRLNNIAILLSRFKISEEEIKSAILAMDDTVLTSENVNALLYITPKDDEVRALRAFREKMDPALPLGKVERFIFTMIEIPRLEKRLEMFQWKLQLEPSVAELRKSLAALAAACEEVKSSKRLPVLLKAVLIIGQVLNRDSYLFISDGFRIESLMKLTDTKGKDNSTTLDYLVKEIEEKMVDLITFSEDIPHVEAAAKVQMDHLTSELAKMRAHLTQMQHELKIVSLQQQLATTSTEAAEQKRRMFESYGEVVTALHDEASVKVKEVSDAMDEATAKWKELALFYGEDGEKMAPQQFFGILHTFVQQFNNARTEGIKRRARAEQERLRKEKEERARLAKEERARQKQQEAEEEEERRRQQQQQQLEEEEEAKQQQRESADNSDVGEEENGNERDDEDEKEEEDDKEEDDAGGAAEAGTDDSGLDQAEEAEAEAQEEPAEEAEETEKEEEEEEVVKVALSVEEAVSEDEEEAEEEFASLPEMNDSTDRKSVV